MRLTLMNQQKYQNLKVVTVFAKDGITILQETRYRVAYDSDGDIVSETVLSE